MKINAVGVVSKNLSKTVNFYSLLGFEFDKFNDSDPHLEAKLNSDASVRLMIDSFDLIKDILGYDPKPSNHSGFAIEYDTPEQVNITAEEIKKAGFKIVKEPWDAFWGQRYCIVSDPEGYMIDLYAKL
jgi:catechol 2,3-dioxygenase-like lactoylglutathione lyase family enzyme